MNSNRGCLSITFYLAAAFFAVGALVSLFDWDIVVAVQAIVVAGLLVLGARLVMRKRSGGDEVGEEERDT